MNDRVSENLRAVRGRIDKAAQECGRAPQTVKLVAVSKQQPDDRVSKALVAGHRVFGENRVQEAERRWPGHKETYPDIELHLIGPLQTNKVKEAVALFDVIQTLDREKLAEKLAAEMSRQGRDLPCFIEINTGAEPQKHGILPAYAAAFHDYCRHDCGLDIRGLMCIPPLDEPPAPHFALLRKLAQSLDLKELSMGMSDDFEKAVPLGATYVRVGTAIFGEREW